MNHATMFLTLLLLSATSVTVGQSESLGLTLQIVSAAGPHMPGEPMLMRLVLRNVGGQTENIPFSSNRDFAKCDFAVEFRDGERVVGRRSYVRSHATRTPVYPLAPGAERRFEFVSMPGYFKPSTEPLPPGTYQVVVRLGWARAALESPPVELVISAPPASEPAQSVCVDRALVGYVEQNYCPWPPCPESATAVLEQARGSRLAAAITVRQLMYRWDKAKHADDQPPEERRRSYESLTRDLSAGLSYPGVGDFAGEVLYALADVNVAQRELIERESSANEALDEQARAKWRRLDEQIVAAAERLQKDFAESSFSEDARDLLQRQVDQARGFLKKHADSPNAGDISATIAAYERALAKAAP